MIRKLQIALIFLLTFFSLNTGASTLEQQCDANDAQACVELASKFALGEGVEQNYSKAKELYSKACEADHINACFYLGLIYSEGNGDKQHNAKAKELFEKVCDANHMEACYTLGY